MHWSGYRLGDGNFTVIPKNMDKVHGLCSLVNHWGMHCSTSVEISDGNLLMWTILAANVFTEMCCKQTTGKSYQWEHTGDLGYLRSCSKLKQLVMRRVSVMVLADPLNTC
jgi:hypothetical protein